MACPQCQHWKRMHRSLVKSLEHAEGAYKDVCRAKGRWEMACGLIFIAWLVSVAVNVMIYFGGM